MKVLMFGWEFPPHITGGLGTACYGLTKALSKYLSDITFVVPKIFGGEDDSFLNITDAESITLIREKKKTEEHWEKLSYIEVGSVLIPYLSPTEFEKHFTQDILKRKDLKDSLFAEKFIFSGKYGKDLLTEVARYALTASVIAKKTDFELIHAHDWLTYPAGIAAKETSGKPLVIHVHATEFDRSGENVNPNVFDIEKSGMEAADKIITVSNLTRNIVINKYGINPEKVTTVHNGVEPVDRKSIDIIKNVNEKIVTFLGRITFQKGPDYFVEAAKKVLEKDDNVRFVMAGSGDMMNKIIRRVAELQIGDKFHFAGFLKGADVVKLFNISDVYVMPSVSEPFGISPLEAMRSGVPVIISKQSGVSEILTHALKVDFWDIDAMADAIHGLVNYQGISKLFRQYGKQEVENLKWDNAAQKVVEVYQSVNSEQ